VKLKMEPEFWQVRLIVTQLPSIDILKKNNHSWLGNVFGDSHVYGSSFLMKDEFFQWQFFFREESRIEAKMNAEIYMYSLTEKFPGILVDIRLLPIYNIGYDNNKEFHEIVLPLPPFYAKINLLSKFLNLFSHHHGSMVEMYVLWQADDSRTGVEKTELEEKIIMDENYKIKIYITIDNKDYQESPILNYLKSDIKNTSGKLAETVKAPVKTWQNIISGTIFFENESTRIITGRYYRDLRNEGCDIVPPGKMPGFVNPKIVDFTLNENIPLKKSFNLNNEKMYFLNSDKPHKILLGNYLKNGALTTKRAYLYLNDFTKHAFISGSTGIGKTSFFAQLNERIRSTGKVGVLTINVSKKIDVQLFKPDILLDETTPDFKVPWISFRKEENNKSQVIEQVAKYTVASLGLTNIAVTHMINAIEYETKGNKDPPKSLKFAFEKVLEWAKKRPYHKKFQINLLRAIENRALRILSDSRLEEIMESNSSIPEWFTQWRNGKNVVIDLSSFTTSVKRLLIHGIFQLVRIHIPDLALEKQYSNKEDNIKLRNIIMMDEIGPIFAKPHDQSVHDDETVTKHYLEVTFEEYLSSFRSRGIGLILADQRPSRLFEGVYKHPNIKFLFKTDIESLQKITLNIDDVEMISGLNKRQVFVEDGANSRKFTFRTTEFSPF